MSLTARKHTLKTTLNCGPVFVDTSGRVRGCEDSSHSTPALLKLLDALLADNVWLRHQAESEQAIADKLGLPKSTLREAIIALIRIGCLHRTTVGVLRESLVPERLVPLYSLRLRIELLAFHRLFDLNIAKRHGLAADLRVVWKQQSELIEEEEQFVNWLDAGISFHSELVRRSELFDLSHILRNLLIQIRVGSFLTRDSVATRQRATSDHEKYIQLVREGPLSGWQTTISDHIRESFRAAFSATDDADEDVIHALWEEIISLATVDPMGIRDQRHQRDKVVA